MRRLLLLALAVRSVAAVDLAVQRIYCNHTGGRSSRGNAHCRHNIEVSAEEPTIICVQNPPLSVGSFFNLLRLFDAETARIHADRLVASVDVQAASEDTWLTGMVGGLPADAQVVASLAPLAATGLQQQLGVLRRTLSAVWSDDRNTRSVAFSPFYPACVGLRATGKRAPVNVTVEWVREGPDLRQLDGGREGSSRSVRGGGSPLLLWSGPLLFVCGLLLYTYAPGLAESVAFHYAGGVSVAMLLGVLVLVFFVWHRTGRRRPGVVISAVLAALGVTATAVRDWAVTALVELARTHWPYVLGYLGFFGCLGYALTFYRLAGGPPAPHERALLSGFLRLVALALLFASSHSLRVCLAAMLGAIGMHSVPRSLSSRAYKLLRRATERGPAGAPSVYTTESGSRATWRPATASGRYLSAEEYEAQGKAATDDALRRHFASPEYQRWLVQNHGRMAMAERDDVGRELTYSDDDEEE